ncbi:DUF6624 domain-containing protein [Sphingomonas elodea]|uniref:DUF6624 domain-containing protein n=1 Tax=Sphingomonas elodea TaxID=179878 RepID=UPI0002E33195|nr:DUF6624 domain-containing protein [Sphingomonas elodea]
MLTAASEPPPELARYFHGEAFDPGDFGWMRGGFAGATPAEARTYAAVNAWLTACFEEGKAHTRDELAAMGVQHADLATMPPRDLRCDVVATAQSAARERSATWAEFQQHVAEARPFATSFLLALRLAEEMAMPRAAASLEERILARTIGEQVLRKATDWGAGEMADAPRLSDGARAVLIAQLSVAMGERDFANTAWLKAEVAKDAWPTIARAGESGSMMAWLLVQHADADPAFQLRALRLMAPLAARGEVNKRNYAYLYDRVMLKISGKQRYATQVTCTAGKRVPLPLEDAAKMPALRSEAGLEPLADYIKSFDGFSPCPKAS